MLFLDQGLLLTCIYIVLHSGGVGIRLDIVLLFTLGS